MHFRRIHKFVSVVTAAAVMTATLIGTAPWSGLTESTAYAAALGTTRVGVHDPSVVKAGDEYYIFGSHMSFAKSGDLCNWTSFTTNIHTDYASIFSVGKEWSATGVSSYDVSGNLWAPDVIYNKSMKKWCMYMSVNGQDWNSSIALCTADNIEGPYTYQGTVVYSGFNNSTHPVSMTDYYKVCGQNASISRYLNSSGKWNANYGNNAIDPTVFYDQSGNLIMVYGSWFGGIHILQLDENTGLRDYNVSYALDTNASDGTASDPYMGTRIAGGLGASGEAPYIEYMDGYYYLFTSYGGFSSDGGYNMRVFRSKDVNGPYKDAAGNYATYTKAVGSNNTSGSVGVRIMSYYQWSCNNIAQVAQGHNSVLTDTDGKKYVVYHTRFDDGYEFHEVRVHQLFTNSDGWLVAAPYEYQGETISNSGYSKSSVTGTYEFLVNSPSASTLDTIATTTSISLNSDGTVTGAVTGTWSMTSGTPYMSITYDGVTYNGVFLKQYDESSAHKEVMTFTAVGSNNVAVMGSYGTATSTISFTETTVSDGTYYIKNVNSGKYLDVANASAENGANIQQYDFNGCAAQKFQIKSDGNGYYYILTGASNYTSCVDVTGGSSENGANMEQWEYWGGDMQKFKLAKNSDGSYSFITKASGNKAAVDVYNMSSDNGANVCQWEYWGGAGQSWTLENALDAAVIEEKEYVIKNVNSGKYLDVANASAENGANIQQYTYNGCAAQVFKIRPVGDGYYAILTGASGYNSCIDVTNASTENGANIEQWEYWGGDMQLFKIVQNSDGSYSFLSKISGGMEAVEVYNFGMDDAVNVSQWEYWGGAAQSWILEEYEAADPYEGTYYLQNVNSGLYMDVVNGSSANNINIQQWGYNGSDAQKFKIQAVGDGYYTILTGASGYSASLDIYKKSTADGANISQYTYKGSTNQLFKIIEHTDGSVSFVSKVSNDTQAIEVYNFGTTDGANVSQWTYWGGAAQCWNLVNAD